MGKSNGQRHHFLYKSTNLINNKYYVGVHSTYNLKDGYLGSGKRLNRSVKKYGEENFKCEILEFFESREELLKREKEIVNEQLINDPLCMNLQIGGNGGWTKEQQSKNSKKRWLNFKKDPSLMNEHIKVCSENFKKAHRDGKIKYDTFTGKIHTKETKDKIGKANSINQKGKNNSQFGTCWIKKKNESLKIKKSNLHKWLKKGWVKGRKM